MFLRASPLCAAVFTLPFALGACDELSYDGKIANSPNSALAGCGSELGCNPEGVSSGLVAKLVGDPDTGELVIRFVTLTKNEDGSFTYDDGDDEVKLEEVPEDSGIYTAANARLTLEEVLTLVAPGTVSKLEDEGLDASVIGDDEIFGFLGYHTDASVITSSEPKAKYLGDAEFKLLVSDQSASGSSELNVNFAEGSATLLAYPDTPGPGVDDVGFDKLVSLNMTVEGYSFTGNQISLYDDGLEVDLDDVVGADTHDAAAGMFFGDVDADGYPAEFGAVAVVTGDDDKLLVLADGELVP